MISLVELRLASLAYMPLSIGLCIKARRQSIAVRLRPMVSGLSNVSMIIALVLIPAVNFQILLEFMSLLILLPAYCLLVSHLPQDMFSAAQGKKHAE